METIDMSVLNQHLFVGSDGSALFVFDPESVFVPNPEGEGLIMKDGVDVLDFLAILDSLDLEHTELNALGLATVLLERRESGDEELAKFA